MLFIGLETFKVKDFLKSHCGAIFSIKSISNKSESFEKPYFFSFSLADDQKSFNAVRNNIFLHFWAVIMEFFYYEVFVILITLQEEFPHVK